MTRPIIQIGDEVREMTESEFQQWQSDVESRAELNRQQAVVEASARLKLADLGLTEAEIKALVGR